MNTFHFWQRWLTLLSWVVVLFGVGMALLNRTPIFLLFDVQVNPAFWGSAGLPFEVDRFQGWIYGIFGATMAGWGIFLVYIARYPFAQRARWAWHCLLQGLLVWYLLDTGISLSFGVFFNAIFNTVILVLLLLPLIFTRKEFL
jgi:hypothetical protein